MNRTKGTTMIITINGNNHLLKWLSYHGSQYMHVGDYMNLTAKRKPLLVTDCLKSLASAEHRLTTTVRRM
ncbi:unnamed protein product [Schistosoma haematobium]|nr:unnamed protein product [Schistosoma haematobium]